MALTPPSTAADTHRPLGQEMVFQPTLSFQQWAIHSTIPQVYTMYRYYRIEIQSSHQTVSKPVSLYLYLYLYHHPSTTQFSGLTSALPPAVHVLTLSQWDQDSVLLRLEHQYERSESHAHSQPVTVSLQVTH